MNPFDDGRPIRLGISACLLGEEVRYDGGHKRDAFLADVLSALVEWVAVCPEVECGMGTPREPIHLVRRAGAIRLRTVGTGEDYTDRMRSYADARLDRLEEEHLCGYVFKAGSPSCGTAAVRVSDEAGSTMHGVGMFAGALQARCPGLPVEEDSALRDACSRQHFIGRVFAYRRLRTLFRASWRLADLVRFHTAHKLELMAHSPSAYRALGRLVAGARDVPPETLLADYGERFMTALSAIATPGRHANVLQHAAGYFTRRLDQPSRVALMAAIDSYRRGIAPLDEPLTLIRQYVREYDVHYLAEQVYLGERPHEWLRGGRAAAAPDLNA